MIRGFGLKGQRVRRVFDKHEQRLSDDVIAVAEILFPHDSVTSA